MIVDAVAAFIDFFISVFWIVELAFAILGAYAFFTLTGPKGSDVINALRKDEPEIELDVPEFMKN